ncbi:unnamed protein product, partial [Linum tenue]
TDLVYRCFIGGLARATTDEALLEDFITYGNVVDSKIR